jgi:cell division protein ZapB
MVRVKKFPCENALIHTVIDPHRQGHYSCGCLGSLRGAELLRNVSMSVNELASLERQVDELLSRLDQLKRENSSLRESQSALMGERSQLIEKTEKARSRVEAIITRLKAMEIDV